MVTTVIAAFDQLLDDLNLTESQSETAKTRESGLKDFFSDAFTMAINPFAIGSYARRTLCRPERDIDLLAPFSVRAYWQQYQDDSSSFLYWVRNKVNDGYATTKVSSKKVAITLDFSVIRADVVPCFPRTGGGYVMPNGSGGWMATNPPFHLALINEANAKHDYKLKNLIKLMKLWNITNGRHLNSFHIELMIEKMTRNYTIHNWPSAMKEVLRVIPGWVRISTDDPWAAGGQVDSYLSQDERDKVVRMLEEDAERAQKAESYRISGETQKAFERWNVVFYQKVPSYG